MKLKIVGIIVILAALIFGAIYGSKYYSEYARQTDSKAKYNLEQEARELAAKAKEEYLKKNQPARVIEADAFKGKSDDESTICEQMELLEIDDAYPVDDGPPIRLVDNDVVAKLTIKACKIDCLVYENEQDDYYLRRDATGKDSRHGEIYTNCYDCDVPIIYGHHMSDGTMFAPLDCAYIGATINLEDIGFLNERTRTYVITRIEDDVPAYKVWDTLKDVKVGLILITCSYGVKDGRLLVIAEEENSAD